MIFKYGIIQFFRSKWGTITLAIFILLGLMLTLSCSIWVISDNNIREYENSFSTIGFAKQKGTGTEIVATWDAALEDYIYSDKEIYPMYQDISKLNFYDHYVIKPKQRPFYTAFCDNLRLFGISDEKTWISRWGSIIMFEPYETLIPNQPVKVKIVDVLWGLDSIGSDVWLCDHYNDKPQKIKAGHRYVAYIQTWPNQHEEVAGNVPYESVPMNMTISTQVLDKTIQRDESVESQNYEEVRKDTDLQKWRELAQAYDRLFKNVTVTPMPSSQLIYEFHEGISSVVDGVDISKEQYEKGDKVCLVPYKLARQNDVGVGDVIKLSFYMANFRDVPSQIFYPSGSIQLNYGPLNEEGKNYPVIEEIEYKIVGLYSSSNRTNLPTGYELGVNEIIVPEKTITGDYSNNIVAYGPMSRYNTTFMIPNGEADTFMSKMKEEGVKDIDITFYDNGYEELVSGMESMKQMAMISALVSLFALLISLLLFCYLVIQKQRRRTAIERLLGLTVKECYVSLPLVFLITIVIGSGSGGILGYYLTDYIINLLNSTLGNSFLLDYSIWNNSVKLAVESPSILWVPIAAVILILLSAVIMTFIIMHLNLKNKPLNTLAAEKE